MAFENPTYRGELISSNRESIRAFGREVEDSILNSDFNKGHAFLFLDIRSRKTLIRALPEVTKYENYGPHALEEFLSKVRLCRGLSIAATLSDEAAKGWKIGAVVEDGWTWKRARRAIRE